MDPCVTEVYAMKGKVIRGCLYQPIRELFVVVVVQGDWGLACPATANDIFRVKAVNIEL